MGLTTQIAFSRSLEIRTKEVHNLFENRLFDFFQFCYDRLTKKLDELLAKKETPVFVNLLSLDGGGIRGLVIIQVISFYGFSS